VRIELSSVIVQDQEHALQFYTAVLGFVKRMDLPAGEFRWITVAAPDDPDGTQLVLEPNANPAAADFQRALLAAGIPLTAFAVDDVRHEYERLLERGVRFTTEPTNAGGTVVAVFEDTCGNLIQIYQTP